MIVNAPVAILYAIQIIFNAILGSHFFPTKWRTTLVSELFKNKGVPTDATKYRPISLVQLLAKLFDTTLFERFRKLFNALNGIKKNCSSSQLILMERSTEYQDRF